MYVTVHKKPSHPQSAAAEESAPKKKTQEGRGAASKKTSLPIQANSEKTVPFLSHEKSRAQIMVKTGKGGVGSSKRFAYWQGGEYATKAVAMEAAKEWLVSERKRQKLD